MEGVVMFGKYQAGKTANKIYATVCLLIWGAAMLKHSYWVANSVAFI